MSDGHHWARLHSSVLDDPDMSGLDNADWAVWAKLLVWTKQHGNNGVVTFNPSNPLILGLFRIKDAETLHVTVSGLPNVQVEGSFCNGKITVTFSNWHKYQSDNSLERVRKHRMTKSVTVQEKRREEKRREEKNKPSSPVAKDTWLTPFAKIWEDVYNGVMPMGAAAANLKFLVTRFTSPVVERHFKNYCESTEAKFVSLPRFASTFGNWAEKGGIGGKQGTDVGGNPCRVRAAEGKYAKFSTSEEDQVDFGSEASDAGSAGQSQQARA